MDEGRYGQVRRQEDRHRKFVCIINDILKTRTEVYENCLSREKYETSFRYVKNVMTVRRALVRQKVLQKCLEMRRRGAEGKRGQYGKYDGIPLHAMAKDVEAYIASKHPKVRRLQKVQRLLKDSIDNGAILGPETMTDRVEQFLQKRIEDMEHKTNEKRKPARDVVDKISPDKADVTDLVSLRLKTKGKIQKFGVTPLTEIRVKDIPEVKDHENGLKDVPLELDRENVFVLKRKPTLILPPIATNRALVQGVDN